MVFSPVRGGIFVEPAEKDFQAPSGATSFGVGGASVLASQLVGSLAPPIISVLMVLYWKAGLDKLSGIIMKSKLSLGSTVVALAVLLTGCTSIYNATMENVFGYEKRELFKKSVAALQDEQKDAQKEFKDALTRLKELYGFKGGELESVYEKVKSSYDRCDEEAKQVATRIENMEDLAKSMFSEWEKEIQQYSNPALATTSREQLRLTKERYVQLSRTVRDAESSMKPVLGQLKDNVLFLKHNLNASAIGSLQGEASGIQKQIEQLLTQMNTSIAASDAFIKTLPK